jgi:predicted nucleic acid-binding Zn ribbon protein
VSEPSPIGAIIQREQKRLWKRCPGLGLQSLWEQAAGAEIAANSQVKSLREGVLTIACSSGAWACELKLHGESLAEKLNRLKPPEEVRKIRFTHRGGGAWK